MVEKEDMDMVWTSSVLTVHCAICCEVHVSLHIQRADDEIISHPTYMYIHTVHVHV